MRRSVRAMSLLATASLAGGVIATATTVGAASDDEAMERSASFTLFGASTGVEGDALSGFLEVYNETTGTEIQYVGSDQFETQLRIRVDGGDPPPVAFTPQPASICAFADEGHLISLEDLGYDIDQMYEDHSEYWMQLGLCEDGNHYGIPWFPNLKSIVFYHMPTFEENGYEIPETFEDLVALSEQSVEDGITPWCMGFGSDDATGWPGTDWIEDIILRQAGPEAYQQWYENEIPFDDQIVLDAFDLYGEIMFGDDFILGGAQNVSGIDFRDAPGPLFTTPEPGCLMLKQGSFIANFFSGAPEYEEGREEEIGTFTFPTIDGQGGAMGGGDTIIVFDDSGDIADILADWTSPEWICTLASASGGGVAPHGGHGVEGVERLPGHADADPACYETDSAVGFAETITEALGENTFVFDASDLMPPEVGQGSFWQAMIDWSQGASAEEVTATVEASWP